MASSNPAFNNPAFQDPRAVKSYPGGSNAAGIGLTPPPASTVTPGQQAGLEGAFAAPAAGSVQTGRMTVEDTVVKTLGLFAILLVTAVAGWMWTMAPVTAAKDWRTLRRPIGPGCDPGMPQNQCPATEPSPTITPAC